jgi:hypothetical protein
MLPAAGKQPASTEPMPLLQGMQTLAPGRVTRRFASTDVRLSHWVPISGQPEEALPIDGICPEYQELGQFEYIDGELRRVPCRRPFAFVVQRCPEDKVSVSSNAFWRWRSQLFARHRGVRLTLYPLGRWRQFGLELEAFTHTRLGGVTVRRFTDAADAAYRPAGDNTTNCTITLAVNGAPVALGYELMVDGLCVRCQLPENVGTAEFWQPALLRAHRPRYFQHRVQTDPALTARANIFQLQWLAEVCLAALIGAAVERETSLQEAAEILATEFDRRTAAVMDDVLQMVQREGDEEEPNLRGDLEGLFANPAVRAALSAAEAVLWEPPGDGLHRWAVGCLRATLGGAILEACGTVAPQAEAGDLLLDLGGGARPADLGSVANPGIEELWITEASPGGTGVIEEVRRRIEEDPPRFLQLLDDALAPAEFENLDADLTRFVREMQRVDSPLPAVAERLRQAGSQQELAEARTLLLGELARAGYAVSRPLVVGLNARVFPAGSQLERDRLLDAALSLRDRIEDQLGIEVRDREFAYVAAQAPEIGALLETTANAPLDGPARYRILAGLLWPRASQVRSTALSSYTPFARLPATDRLVLLRALGQADVPLPADTSAAAVRARLAETGTAALSYRPEDRGQLRALLLDLSAAGLDAGYLRVYPQVRGVRRDDGGPVLVLHAREVLS